MTRNLDIKQLALYPSGGLVELGRVDSTNNIFFSRELEHMIPEIMETELAKLSARSIMPIDTSANPTDERITYRQITRVGAAKIITDYANDVPLVNIYKEEFSGKVRTIGAGAQYSIDEVAKAAAAGTQLQREDATAAGEAIYFKENDVAFNGDANHGLVGLLTAAGIPESTVVNPGLGTAWTTKTGIEMADDMFSCVDAVPAATQELENPTELWLPPAQYRLASRSLYSPGTDSTTVLQYFMKNHGSVNTVRRVRELKGAGPGGEDMMVACTPDKSKFRLNLVMEIQSLPEQAKQMAIQVYWRLKTGGVTVHKELSLNKNIGI